MSVSPLIIASIKAQLVGSPRQWRLDSLFPLSFLSPPRIQTKSNVVEISSGQGADGSKLCLSFKRNVSVTEDG